MIIEEQIKLTWNGRNKAHYENLGYIYTRQREPFYIKSTDLHPNSHIKVKVQCDNCEKVNSITYRDYRKRKTEFYYCNQCANKLYGGKTRSEIKLKSGISLLEYGIKFYGKDFTEKYWSSKNKFSPDEVSHGSKHLVWIKCQHEHEDYQVACYSFSSGRGCPYCSGRKICYENSLYKYIKDSGLNPDKIWSNKNTKTALDYTTKSGQKVWWKCSNGKHEDFLRRVADMTDCGFVCLKCSYEKHNSYLQDKIVDYTKSKYHYTILNEQFCTIEQPVNPITGYKLRYDNEIVELKLIIECMGGFHYKASGFVNSSSKRKNISPKEELKYLQWKDAYKKEYALSQGYHYLEIPYWSETNDEYKKLIDVKVSSITESMVKNVS